MSQRTFAIRIFGNFDKNAFKRTIMVDNIKDAQNDIIKLVQRYYFKKEIKNLKTNDKKIFHLYWSQKKILTSLLIITPKQILL